MAKTTKKSGLFLTKKAQEGFAPAVKQYKKIIEIADKKGLNESDTSNIINDMLGEIWGYDKFFDVTSEYKIKGQFCDFGVKIEEKLRFLIEVKAISLDLNGNHLFQASSYAGNEGVNWVILTNLKQWQLYHLSFGSKIQKDLVLSIDFLEDSSKDIMEKTQYFHKESFKKNKVEELWKMKLATSEKNIKKACLSTGVVKKIQSELKTMTGMKISEDDIVDIMSNVFKCK